MDTRLGSHTTLLARNELPSCWHSSDPGWLEVHVEGDWRRVRSSNKTRALPWTTASPLHVTAHGSGRLSGISPSLHSAKFCLEAGADSPHFQLLCTHTLASKAQPCQHRYQGARIRESWVRWRRVAPGPGESINDNVSSVTRPASRARAAGETPRGSGQPGLLTAVLANSALTRPAGRTAQSPHSTAYRPFLCLAGCQCVLLPSHPGDLSGAARVGRACWLLVATGVVLLGVWLPRQHSSPVLLFPSSAHTLSTADVCLCYVGSVWGREDRSSAFLPNTCHYLWYPGASERNAGKPGGT